VIDEYDDSYKFLSKDNAECKGRSPDAHSRVYLYDTIRYDTIGEFNVDWKAEYSALSSTRSQKKKLKHPTPVPL